MRAHDSSARGGVPGEHRRTPVLVAGLRTGRDHLCRHQPDSTRLGPVPRHHVHRLRPPGRRRPPGAAAPRARRAAAAGAGRRGGVPRHRGGGRTRRAPPRRAGRDPLADLHLRHHLRPQGRHLQPGPDGANRAHPGGATGSERRRHVLRGDADVPLQRADGRDRTRRGDRRHHRAAAQVQRLVVPQRRAHLRGDVLQLCRQAPQLRPGHPAASRRRRQHLAHRLRQRGQRARHRGIRRTFRVPSHRRVRLQRGRDPDRADA